VACDACVTNMEGHKFKIRCNIRTQILEALVCQLSGMKRGSSTLW
jgi:hypothetical protein